jgi:multidrug transporter EmrE-like cation transporter
MGTNSKSQGAVAHLEQKGKQVAHDATVSPLMENLLRLGYLVRGLVYGVIGLMALQVVIGGGGALTDTQGAIAIMGGAAGGGILLYAVLVGLASYGLWGLVRAIVDPLHKGKDTKGIAERVGYAISGISYLLLALATYGLITGRATAVQNGSQTAQTQQTVGTLLSQPWGALLVMLIALIVMGVGLFQVNQGIQPQFHQQFTPYALNTRQRTWITRMGRFGMAARGLVFMLIGLFLFLAAYHHDPSRAQGIEGVLASLLQQPYGIWLLGIVALGLIAFGVYSALSGVWLRLKR